MKNLLANSFLVMFLFSLLALPALSMKWVKNGKRVQRYEVLSTQKIRSPAVQTAPVVPVTAPKESTQSTNSNTD